MNWENCARSIREKLLKAGIVSQQAGADALEANLSLGKNIAEAVLLGGLLVKLRDKMPNAISLFDSIRVCHFCQRGFPLASV